VKRLRFSSVLAAPPADVWARITSQAGLDHEFLPLMRMRFPSAYRGATIETLPVGEPVGRAWLLLGGVVPVDYDDLCLVEVEPGRRFLERSTLGSARTWEHERTVEAQADGGSVLTDRLAFEPRVPGPLGERAVQLLFNHRHRRLRAWFGVPEVSEVSEP
jgi:hypothetical protein